MGYDVKILEDAGLDVSKGIGYTGNEEKYISAIQRFYRNHEKNRLKIEEYLAAEDYENFMITVHAMKSNSRMIGALTLGDMFEELETAARSGNTGLIDHKTPSVLSAYDDLIEKIRPLGEMDTVKPADEISAEEALTTANKLLTALDDFDDELSKELALKLTGYPFRITQKELLTQAIGYINDFLYDEAAEKIREIISSPFSI